MRSPCLATLTPLTQLTQLHLGGCGVGDDDVTTNITSFRNLQDLDLFASQVQHSVPALGQLPALSKLNLAWSKVAAHLPLFPGLTHLDLSHCRLTACRDEAAFVAAEAMQQLQVLVLVQAGLDPVACEVLETVMRWVGSWLATCMDGLVGGCHQWWTDLQGRANATVTNHL